RPVHRPHGAEDEGSAQEGDGRRPVHRRGLLPLPAGERARLRAGVDRNLAAGDGEQPRRPRRHPGRLRRQDGPLFPLQSRLPLARRPSHRLPRYTDADLLAIGEKMLAGLNYTLSNSARRALMDYIPLRRTQPLFANARSIRNALDRARLRQANRLLAAGDRELTLDKLTTIEAEDFRQSRVFDKTENGA